MNPRPGEVYWVDFAGAAGSEADAIRPAIVVQTDWVRSLQTSIVVPCSEKAEERRHQPTCVFVPKALSGLPWDSVAVCHLLTAAAHQRLREQTPVGNVGEEVLIKIRLILTELLDISAETFLGP